MNALAFSFTKLVVADLDAAERFYCGVFGMQRLRKLGTDEYQYSLDEVILSLGQAGHVLIVTRYRERPCPPAGAAWTGFIVPDIAGTLAEIEAAGGRVEVAVHQNPENAVLAAIAADPDGHLIEIIQMLQAP